MIRNSFKGQKLEKEMVKTIEEIKKGFEDYKQKETNINKRKEFFGLFLCEFNNLLKDKKESGNLSEGDIKEFYDFFEKEIDNFREDSKFISDVVKNYLVHVYIGIGEVSKNTPESHNQEELSKEKRAIISNPLYEKFVSLEKELMREKNASS